ncbi:lactate utilization protein [Desulfosporosinus sp. FKB]|uniref:lactate utilization protein n=1 Tax=Desulfosporosinus sp. FKB TaxID=1969835 RepID=UPI000B499A93|nr:lactate utilization protein [Desulfosporosinus sp. FKB]
MKYEKIIQSLTHNGYKVSFFEASDDAANYVVENISGVTVGFGDSATLASINFAELLSEHNSVVDPSKYSGLEFNEIAKKTLTTDVFFTSVNGVAETGELVNIDGTGNRIAGSLFGHKKVFFVFGTNKIEPTLEKAIWRARNIAAPQNAKRFGYKTPCAVKGDRCYNCSSPDRICNTLNIHLKKMKGVDAEIIIIDEILGM